MRIPYYLLWRLPRVRLKYNGLPLIISFLVTFFGGLILLHAWTWK